MEKDKINTLSGNYKEDCRLLDRLLRVGESFDMIKKPLSVGGGELMLYYIDGMIKDDTLQRILQYFVSIERLDEEVGSCEEFLRKNLPYVETDETRDVELMVTMVLSGATLALGSMFGRSAVIIDARTYPARGTEEPESDKVLRGSHDGLVETLVFNTALIRRRIRDPRLTFSYVSVGSESRTDVCVAYIEGEADMEYVKRIKRELSSLKVKTLPMGQQSLSECLMPRGAWNPFPKVRYTERPDTAAAQLYEGNVLILCDTSPAAMILPTSIFDFMQETDDYALSPLTGCILRLVRHFSMLLTLVFTPIWLAFIIHPELLPEAVAFILPQNQAKIPVSAQLFLVEIMLDALKLASLNTPSPLSGSLSAVAGLILGDFAVSAGWVIPEVVLYMAFISIVNFTQPGIELGFAFKYLRIGLLVLTVLFGFYGFFAGIIGIAILAAATKTVFRKESYLYPLIPFNGKALLRLFFRMTKRK